MSMTREKSATGWEADIWRCTACGGAARLSAAGDRLACGACGREYPIKDDILVVDEQTTANNEVARSFYDSPLWPKFRFWEHFTWFCNGGERRARNKVLRHLPEGSMP